MAKHKKTWIQSGSGTSLSAGSKADIDGLPVQRFKKDLIREGYFIHPLTLQEIDVTRERLDHWCRMFSQMNGNGIDIEVKNDHSFTAEDVRGYLKDLYVEEEFESGKATLYGICEMRGEKGIELAETVKNVSIEINPDYKDGEGRHYKDCIDGVAICQRPVINGQKDFEKIAASHNGADALPFILKQELETMKLSKELIEKVSETVGGDVEVTEDNALELLLSHVAELTSNNAELKAQVTELSTKVKPDEDKTEKVPQMDADVAEEVALSYAERVDMLVEQGKCSPKQKELMLSLIGGEGKRNVVHLSTKSGIEGKSVVSRVIDILKEGQSISGQATGKQTLNHVAGKQTPAFDPANTASEMLTEAGYKEAEQ
jgi:hypothetical protein